MNNLIKDALRIPVSEPRQTISVSPVTLKVEGRPIPLELRITAPLAGDKLPVVLLSHGHGPSLYLPSKDGYGPIVNFFAEHGFVVIQPTHLNSKVAGLPADAPGGPLFWRSRVEDMVAILDQLDAIEAAVPPIAGRLDRDRIAVIGHSMGGQTAGLLLGARLTDPNDPVAQNVDMHEPRIKAGIMLTAPGNGGASLSEMAASRYSFFNPDFSYLVTPALIVVGDEDASAHLTVRGPAWHEDAYHEGPGAEALLTMIGGKHGLGGIAGYDARETDDEDPERLEIALRITWAWLRSALYEGDDAWAAAEQALVAHCAPHARVEVK
ncbi:hypothetical protein Q9Q95_14275 [Sphingomonas sp. DG1-23]|uniref:alpha/beta hydrolase family protein n=1 Tax=Sphingomonas sp. DG1-23 TaxID=3068316 RepID=UPI00273E8AEE|nr:hypothetical protein [Sphingomonas sp. DG1-23]MDP5280093.1 hypothetical protein [Sphingomonas sp. DG1-23]